MGTYKNPYSGGNDREAIKLMRKQQRMQERLAAKNSKRTQDTGGAWKKK